MNAGIGRGHLGIATASVSAMTLVRTSRQNGTGDEAMEQGRCC
jgi:hypothetical protein